jgi:hypothetical protein
MPVDHSLSERDRLRLAQLLKGPLIPPPDPPRKLITIRWPELPGWSKSAVKTHFRAHWRAWAAGGAAGLACLLMLAVAVEVAGRRDDSAVKLQVTESRGQLQIHWDAQSDLVRQATGAKLFITDGIERLFVNLDSNRLRRGTVSYARQSGRVELRLALAEPDGRTFEQKAIFYGAPPAEEETPQLSASAQPPAPASLPAVATEAKPGASPAVMEHRSRRKPLVKSGTDLPFTCSPGDIFHKTDAPAGWDTFTCKGKNVWSRTTAQAGDARPTQRPSANTLTAKPTGTSTT